MIKIKSSKKTEKVLGKTLHLKQENPENRLKNWQNISQVADNFEIDTERVNYYFKLCIVTLNIMTFKFQYFLSPSIWIFLNKWVYI